jgi:cobalt-zinc-cadmium efflux system protein
MSGSKKDLNIRGAFLHMAADALVSLGVVIAGALYLWQGWLWLDAVVSLLIAAVVVVGTWSLFRQSLHLLFDGVPAHIELGAVHNYFSSLPNVTDVHDLHVWAMSTSETALTVHLVMCSQPEDDSFIQNIAHEMHERFGISHTTTQIEHGGACQQAPSCIVQSR